MRAQEPVHRFGEFVLDEGEKQLLRGGKRVAINARYFEALALLVRNPGALVTKDRFFNEVWSGMTVGDEALTQCIKSLRKALGDEHRDPRYIATEPKRGYRFVAPVDTGLTEAGAVHAAEPVRARGSATPLQLALAGTLGGGAAGVVGGVIYGLVAAGSGGSAISALAVLTAVTAAIGLLGGFGVSFGMAAASLVLRRGWSFSIAGGAAGGLLVGAAFHLLGTDALHLLFGRAPGDFTGGLEGLVLGGALAAGARLGGGLAGPGWRPAIGAGIAAGVAGALISVAGGKLLGGSLVALADAFDQSQLRLAAMLGPAAQALAAGVEGLLFGLCLVGAILLSGRGAR